MFGMQKCVDQEMGRVIQEEKSVACECWSFLFPVSCFYRLLVPNSRCDFSLRHKTHFISVLEAV